MSAEENSPILPFITHPSARNKVRPIKIYSSQLRSAVELNHSVVLGFLGWCPNSPGFARGYYCWTLSGSWVETKSTIFGMKTVATVKFQKDNLHPGLCPGEGG